MKSRITGPCKTACRFSESVRQHLNRFAIATILAVALLALAWPAAAEIVYRPANIYIGRNSSYNLDLNNDGVTDFAITTRFGLFGCLDRYYTVGAVYETPASGNGAEGSPPARLNAGDQIGPSQTFYQNQGEMAYAQQVCPIGSKHRGKWYRNSGYLGLLFLINGEIHYGWASLTVGWDSATLTGYAYETIPNTPINAGQTK